MYKALIHSVPGSGTRFVCDFCERCLGYKRVAIEKQLEDSLSGNVFCQSHAWQNVDAAATNERVRVIFPLRPPYLSYITRRYRVGVPSDPPERKQEIIASHWKELIRKSEYMEPLYVPVMAGLDRRTLLQSVATHLEAYVMHPDVFEEWVEDWPRVGKSTTNEDRKEYAESQTIDGKVPHFLDFAVDWYEDVVKRLQDEPM